MMKINQNWSKCIENLIRPDISDTEDILCEYIIQIDVFQIDTDYVTYSVPLDQIEDNGVCYSKIKCTNNNLMSLTEISVIRIYGVLRNHSSILLNIYNFWPYFYIKKPKNFTTRHIDALTNLLNDHLKSQHFKKSRLFVIKIEIVKKQSLMFYSSEAQVDFLKITVSLPRMVSTLRSFIENRISLTDENGQVIQFAQTVYEANLPYVMRFLLDCNIVSGGWLKDYIIIPKHQQTSHCSLEVDLDYKSLIALEASGEWISLGPMRILSFDIECIKQEGTGFPMAKDDPVIAISSVIETVGFPDKKWSFIFTVGECAPIPESYVFSFVNEPDMLLAWSQFFRAADPDLLTGYNIINFDIPYLIERANALNLDEFCYLGRIKTISATVKSGIKNNKMLGLYENKETNIEGRIIFDVHDLIRREYSLKSYSLNYVSFEFLKELKDDVHYSIMKSLYYGTNEERRRLAKYCLKDSILPLKLIDKLLLLINYVEMARVTSTPIKLLITRGQQIKVTMQILRQCKNMGLVMPCIRSGDQDTHYEGATVMEPIKGYHKVPIAVLDYQSLYPSIMIAYNICYSTLIRPEDINKYNENDYNRVPDNEAICFIKPHIKVGLLPIVVDNLLKARAKAKDEMKSCDDPFTKSVLNGRQLALKITANSVYGYTGATSGGWLPCIQLATAITSFGRELIGRTASRIESIYTIKNGFSTNAQVVYGDTDSVMINFGVDSVDKAMKLGTDAANKISSEEIKPIRLVFEKVYYPFLLLTKKRYAGLLYTNPNTYDKIDCKGIESVRRDFCMLVQQMTERGAIDFIKQKIRDLLTNEIDISLLVVTKSLGKLDYEARLPHVELAKKMRIREPANAPGVGDRVSYIITKGTKGQAQFDRAEDPLYVVENDLPIDTGHYIESIKSTIIKFFEVIMPNPESLFSGDHTRTITESTVTTGALSKFMVKSHRCMGCFSVIKQPPLCKYCAETERERLVLEHINSLRIKESAFASMWSECQRCQQSLHNVVKCSNGDCPIFYRRAKVRKDLIGVQNKINSLQIAYE